MRLKGGKVLLDITTYGDVKDNDVQIDLTNEEVKAIIEKGLLVKLIIDGLKFVFEPLVYASDGQSNIIAYYSIYAGNSERTIILDINNNTFSIVEP